MVSSQKLPGNRLALFVATFSFMSSVQGLLTILALPLPTHLSKGGHWQFLTNLSLAVSIAVFALNIVAQLTKKISIFHLKNHFHAVAFALESIVAIVYWPLRIFFTTMIMREETRIPLMLDISIHLIPVVSLAIDYYFFMPQWAIKTSHAYVMCLILATGYWCILELLLDETSLYPYPFLQAETKPRAIIFVFVTHIAFANFCFQRRLHDVIIGKEVDDTYEKNK